MSVSGEALSGGIFNFPASKFSECICTENTPIPKYGRTVQDLLAEGHAVYLPREVKQYRNHKPVSYEVLIAQCCI